MVIRPPDV